ncbi:hypothetical protein [Bdellovibrio bacteriovorus]|uniref:hypothetical protein n=1 Tax=Bdellovibrio TaxID=958 RepID=UPI0035A8F165
MKTFTYPHKKWVMTGALLAVLGFNVSFNSHSKDGIASADFASTVAEGVVQGKIYTAKGVVPVKYIDNGEDKVLAIVPKKMTEGKVCDTCGYDSIALSVKNKEDIDSLNVELMKAMEKQLKEKKPEVAEADASAEGQEGDKVVKKSPLEAIEKACSRHKENADILSCTAEKFVAALKKKSDPAIEKTDALDFYREHIESLVKSELTEARRIANRVRRASVNVSQWSIMEDSDDTMKNPSDIREETLKVVRSIISGIPSKYEDVRKRLLLAETEMIKAEAQELQQTFIQARDSKDPSQGVYLFKEGELRRADLQTLLQDMGYHTTAGLDKAVSTRDLSYDLQRQYESYFSDFSKRIQEGMWTNPYSFMGAGNGNTTLPGVNLDPRFANPGRNSGTVGTPGISSRTGANMNATGTQTILVPVQVPAGTTSVPQIGIPTQNNGVSFGTMGPASADSLRMRTEIQNRFPRQ